MIDENIYLFCVDYHYNHIVKKERIDKYIDQYARTIYGPEMSIESAMAPHRHNPNIVFKRIYEANKDEALRLYNDNLDYCEARAIYDAARPVWVSDKVEEVEEPPVKKKVVRKKRVK